LHAIGVLVLVDQDILEMANHGLERGVVGEQIEDGVLKVCKVDPVGFGERLLVGLVGPAHPREEGIVGVHELRGVHQLLSDLVEIPSFAFDRTPAGRPPPEEEVVLRRADDPVEVLEDEKKLCQFIERVVVMAKRRAVAVLRKDAVAQAVDGRDGEFGEVAGVFHLARRAR
jgi:hypothetical protein